MEKYKTVKDFAFDEIIEKKSRFIGYIKPVNSETEALDFIGEISKKHWDATHNVYAYNIIDGNVSRCSDDGEPAKTAGAPVLDVILKEEITNAVIVVTRYFGGTLLGTGGLVKAYSKAAKAALDKAKTVVMTNCVEFIISISYTLLGKCENEFRNCDVVITKKEYADDVNLIGICKNTNYNKLCEKIKELSNGKITLVETRNLFYGFEE